MSKNFHNISLQVFAPLSLSDPDDDQNGWRPVGGRTRVSEQGRYPHVYREFMRDDNKNLQIISRAIKERARLRRVSALRLLW